MNRSKKTRIVSLLALVLCIAMVAVFAFAFAGCDDESASADAPRDADEYENENVKEKIKISEEPDENGIEQWEYFYGYCDECDDWFDCQGHYVYRTSDGAIYTFYPVKVPMTLTDENGNLCSEIQVSLIFEEEPYIYEDGENIYIQARPSFIEIVSLTGEALENVTILSDPSDDEYTVIDQFVDATFKVLAYIGFRDNGSGIHTSIYEEGAHVTLLDGHYMAEPKSYSVSSTAIVFNPLFYNEDGYYVFYYTDFELGKVYTYDFYAIADSVIWDAVVNGNGDIEWAPLG